MRQPWLLPARSCVYLSQRLPTISNNILMEKKNNEILRLVMCDAHHSCPLCKGQKTTPYFSDAFRDYRICLDCSLVFVPKIFHLSDEREKQRYDLHKNDPADPRYRAFLSRLCNPLKARLPERACGLDFGCGPGPTLSAMFQACGYVVDIYDKFYARNPEVFRQKYDFVTTTEVVEHLKDPQFELQRLYRLVKPRGILGIMTKLVIDKSAFENWHYKRDPTHICFFSKSTFEWLGNIWQSEVEFIGDDVILIHK